jgi:hypothetical protein
LLAAGALIACVLGCSSSDKQTAVPPNADNYPSRYADAVCGVLGPCCSDNGLAFDQGSCRLGGAAFGKQGADRATQAGATFDAKAADACIEGATRLTQSCRSVSADASVSAACARVWVGTKKPSERCTSDLDCAPGDGRGYCYGASLDGTTAGTCVVRTTGAKVGDVCGVTNGTPPAALADCAASDLQCDLGSRTCQPLTAIGTPCPGLTTCARGAYCDGTSCAAKLATGATCKADGDCESGVCLRNACAKNGAGGLAPCGQN